jgi:pimeloyl-ACP methyl ester carboxylesterase/lysophospholipase L1-like esterase
MKKNFLIGWSFLAMFSVISPVSAEEGVRVAILGDSITYHGGWASRVESALRSAPEYREAEIVNFGLPSETVSGLSEEGHAGGQFPRPCLHERLGRVLEAFRPTEVIVCYGMNDGIMHPPDAGRFKAFQDGMLKLKAEVERAGADFVVVTPPLYDGDRPSNDPQRYDAVLDGFAEWLMGKRAEGWQVIDIREGLREGIAEAKRTDGKYVFAGDKVHPGEDGHRMIAEAVCAGLWRIRKLRGAPNVAEGGALQLLRQRHDLLKHAWLSATRHIRPGIPAGKPLEEASVEAAGLLESYAGMIAPKGSQWNGYERVDFLLNGRAVLLVKPKVVGKGSPWIWRTEFFGHEPQGDLGLLEKGFHVAYIDMQNLYGGPQAMKIMDGCFLTLRDDWGLSGKVVLEGFSRGGLYAFNWAAHRPGNVAALYVDAPVCDFKSWPGGKGAGPGSAPDWERCLKAYGLTEAEALVYPKNPVDQLEPLAKAGIPILAVIGDADEVVPVSENIDLVEKRYRALGGLIEVIRKPGGKHHPHSLKDPTPIVDFLVKTVGD